MKSLTGATWPSRLRSLFNEARQGQPHADPPEARYYGAYNMLFLSCFGGPYLPYFTVAPNSPPLRLSLRHTDHPMVCFVVSDTNGHPVLVAEIKDDSWADRADLRAEADDRMRQWVKAVLPDCRLPRVYGLSLLGTSLRVYVGNVATGEIEPALATCPSSGRNLPNDFLEGAWNVDIISDEGFTKMKEIVGYIVANLYCTKEGKTCSLIDL